MQRRTASALQLLLNFLGDILAGVYCWCHCRAPTAVLPLLLPLLLVPLPLPRCYRLGATDVATVLLLLCNASARAFLSPCSAIDPWGIQ